MDQLEYPLYQWLKKFKEKPDYSGESDDEHCEWIFDEKNPFYLSKAFDFVTSSESIDVNTQLESQPCVTYESLFGKILSHYQQDFKKLIIVKAPNFKHLERKCKSCYRRNFNIYLYLIFYISILNNKFKKFNFKFNIDKINYLAMQEHDINFLPVVSFQDLKDFNINEQESYFNDLCKSLKKLLHWHSESGGREPCNNLKLDNSDEDVETDDNSITAASTIRQLQIEMKEKSDLLQDCKEELELKKKEILNLEYKLYETHKKLKIDMKQRDELDELREEKENSIKLNLQIKNLVNQNMNLQKMIEKMTDDNRMLKQQNDKLMDKISFLTIDDGIVEGPLLFDEYSGGHDNSPSPVMEIEKFDHPQASSTPLRPNAGKPFVLPPTPVVTKKVPSKRGVKRYKLKKKKVRYNPNVPCNNKKPKKKIIHHYHYYQQNDSSSAVVASHSKQVSEQPLAETSRSQTPPPPLPASTASQKMIQQQIQDTGTLGDTESSENDDSLNQSLYFVYNNSISSSNNNSADNDNNNIQITLKYPSAKAVISRIQSINYRNDRQEDVVDDDGHYDGVEDDDDSLWFEYGCV